MEKPQIISEIEKRVRKKNDYTLWTIGITDTDFTGANYDYHTLDTIPEKYRDLLKKQVKLW